MGIKDEETVSSIGARLSRLHGTLDEKGRQEFVDVADGRGMDQIAAELISATDLDQWALSAAEEAGAADDESYEPSEEELLKAKETLLGQAVRPLMKAEVRQRILSLREKAAQIIDMTNPDAVLFAGWTDSELAKDAVEDFEQFIQEHHDEYLALKAYYQRPYRLRPGYDDLKELAEAIAKPPLELTPEKLWAAYEAVDASKVKGSGMRRTLTDLVQLVRFAMENEDELLPRKEVVMLRFDIWLTEQQSTGRDFTAEQLQWLGWMAEHIASSMTLEPEDFDLEPFAQEGGLLGAHEAFGDALDELLNEVNEELAAA
jgi:type I restriction enzyme R subunit